MQGPDYKIKGKFTEIIGIKNARKRIQGEIVIMKMAKNIMARTKQVKIEFLVRAFDQMVVESNDQFFDG